MHEALEQGIRLPDSPDAGRPGMGVGNAIINRGLEWEPKIRLGKSHDRLISGDKSRVRQGDSAPQKACILYVHTVSKASSTPTLAQQL